MIGNETYSIEEAKQMPNKTFKSEEAIRFLEFAKSNNWTQQSFLEAIEYYQSSNEFHNNIEYDGRSIVGDDPDNINDKNYGNSNVTDRNKHGTHVSGIVVNIFDNAVIMPIRCVPDGDEYDKDVALSIRYAVDNGAKIINFSFGKKYSPHSNWVVDAMKYASQRDVLIVNAAGNDSNDIDLIENESYPTDQKDGNEFLNNLLTVGASSYSYDSGQIAYFSNYGSKNVDLFAPGFQVYSSVLDGKFEYLNGTSMAAPNVTGVAAILRSFYPKLSASSIKHILMASGINMNKTLKKPNSEEVLDPYSFSISGKTVNLYNALLYASTFKEKDPPGSLRKFKSK
jgi:subtilisin family serine protease